LRTGRQRWGKINLCLALVVSAVVGAAAQSAGAGDARGRERGAELIRQAAEARGGARYLAFKTLVTTGQFTPFDKGVPTVPLAFVDYIVYPEKERTEFGKGKRKDRRIQVNVGATGWVYDGNVQTLKDQNEQQTREFVENLEHDLDRLLRGGAGEAGVEARHVGREETRPGERADVVAIRLKSGRQVSLMLDSSTHLPMSLSYERTDDQGLSRYELRYFQYVAYGGVKFPNIVDFYRDGVQTARINVENIELDAPVDEALFAKPAGVKAVK